MVTGHTKNTFQYIKVIVHLKKKILVIPKQ